MSNSHKGSNLALNHQVAPVKFNTAHFNFKEDLIGIQYGEPVLPIGSLVASIRKYEGVFGGSVALEEGTTNASIMNGQNGVTPIGGDGSPALSIMDPTMTFRNRMVAKFTTGTSGNFYINGGTKLSTATSSTDWVSTIYIKRVDNTPITIGIGTYMYISGNSNVNTNGLVTPVEDGWYRVTRARNGLISGYPTLFGCYGLGASTEYYIAEWQIEPKKFPTSYVDGTRSNLNLNYPIYSYRNISGWVKANYSNSGWQRIIGSYTDPNKDHWYLGIDSGNLLHFRLRNKVSATETVLNISSSEVNLRDGEWHFFSIAFDDINNKIKLSVDGISKEVGFADTISYFPYELQFGKHIANDAEQWNGLISEIRIDQSIVGDREIRSWYESKAPFYNPYDYRSYAE